MTRIKETDLAQVVIAWLQDLRWDVYQEVTGAPGRADIVARQGPLLWVIETKSTFGLHVLGQANSWRPHAHRVSVAVPYSRMVAAPFAGEVLRNFGIGLLIVSMQEKRVQERIRPALNRKPWKIPACCPEHQTYAPAGTNGGGYYTPYTRTCRLVVGEVKQSPGITMKELVDRVDHHYASPASARQSFKFWIERGEIPGVETFYNEAKRLCVRPKEG